MTVVVDTSTLTTTLWPSHASQGAQTRQRGGSSGDDGNSSDSAQLLHVHVRAAATATAAMTSKSSCSTAVVTCVVWHPRAYDMAAFATRDGRVYALRLRDNRLCLLADVQRGVCAMTLLDASAARQANGDDNNNDTTEGDGDDGVCVVCALDDGTLLIVDWQTARVLQHIVAAHVHRCPVHSVVAVADACTHTAAAVRHATHASPSQQRSLVLLCVSADALSCWSMTRSTATATANMTRRRGGGYNDTTTRQALRLQCVASTTPWHAQHVHADTSATTTATMTTTRRECARFVAAHAALATTTTGAACDGRGGDSVCCVYGVQSDGAVVEWHYDDDDDTDNNNSSNNKKTTTRRGRPCARLRAMCAAYAPALRVSCSVLTSSHLVLGARDAAALTLLQRRPRLAYTCVVPLQHGASRCSSSSSNNDSSSCGGGGGGGHVQALALIADTLLACTLHDGRVVVLRCHDNTADGGGSASAADGDVLCQLLFELQPPLPTRRPAQLHKTGNNNNSNSCSRTHAVQWSCAVRHATYAVYYGDNSNSNNNGGGDVYVYHMPTAKRCWQARQRAGRHDGDDTTTTTTLQSIVPFLQPRGGGSSSSSAATTASSAASRNTRSTSGDGNSDNGSVTAAVVADGDSSERTATPISIDGKDAAHALCTHSATTTTTTPARVVHVAKNKEERYVRGPLPLWSSRSSRSSSSSGGGHDRSHRVVAADADALTRQRIAAVTSRWVDAAAALCVGRRGGDADGSDSNTHNEHAQRQQQSSRHARCALHDVLRDMASVYAHSEASFVYNMDGLRAYVARYGSFPARYRLAAWSFVLALPDRRTTRPQLAALLRRRRHACVAALMQPYAQLPRTRVRRVVEAALSALAWHAPVFATASCIPAFAFTFAQVCNNTRSIHNNKSNSNNNNNNSNKHTRQAKRSSNDDDDDDEADDVTDDVQTVVELLLAFFVNWGRDMFTCYPRCPARPFVFVEALLRHIDAELHTHLHTVGATVEVWGWQPLLSFYTDMLPSAAAWLQVMDHAVAMLPLWLFVFAVCYVHATRAALLTCRCADEVLRVLQHDPTMTTTTTTRAMQQQEEQQQPSSSPVVAEVIVAAHALYDRCMRYAHTTATTATTRTAHALHNSDNNDDDAVVLPPLLATVRSYLHFRSFAGEEARSRNNNNNNNNNDDDEEKDNDDNSAVTVGRAWAVPYPRFFAHDAAVVRRRLDELDALTREQAAAAAAATRLLALRHAADTTALRAAVMAEQQRARAAAKYDVAAHDWQLRMAHERSAHARRAAEAAARCALARAKEVAATHVHALHLDDDDEDEAAAASLTSSSSLLLQRQQYAHACLDQHVEAARWRRGAQLTDEAVVRTERAAEARVAAALRRYAHAGKSNNNNKDGYVDEGAVDEGDEDDAVARDMVADMAADGLIAAEGVAVATGHDGDDDRVHIAQQQQQRRRRDEETAAAAASAEASLLPDPATRAAVAAVLQPTPCCLHDVVVIGKNNHNNVTSPTQPQQQPCDVVRTGDNSAAAVAAAAANNKVDDSNAPVVVYTHMTTEDKDNNGDGTHSTASALHAHDDDDVLLMADGDNDGAHGVAVVRSASQMRYAQLQQQAKTAAAAAVMMTHTQLAQLHSTRHDKGDDDDNRNDDSEAAARRARLSPQTRTPPLYDNLLQRNSTPRVRTTTTTAVHNNNNAVRAVRRTTAAAATTTTCSSSSSAPYTCTTSPTHTTTMTRTTTTPTATYTTRYTASQPRALSDSADSYYWQVQ